MKLTSSAVRIHSLMLPGVGDRLARAALAKIYGRKMEFSGPVFDSMNNRRRNCRRQQPEREDPGGVRYAWVNFSDGGLLYSAAGLPAVQFRTDEPKFENP